MSQLESQWRIQTIVRRGQGSGGRCGLESQFQVISGNDFHLRKSQNEILFLLIVCCHRFQRLSCIAFWEVDFGSTGFLDGALNNWILNKSRFIFHLNLYRNQSDSFLGFPRLIFVFFHNKKIEIKLLRWHHWRTPRLGIEGPWNSERAVPIDIQAEFTSAIDCCPTFPSRQRWSRNNSQYDAWWNIKSCPNFAMDSAWESCVGC